MSGRRLLAMRCDTIDGILLLLVGIRSYIVTSVMVMNALVFFRSCLQSKSLAVSEVV